MLHRFKTNQEIIAWLEQEYAKPFSGWDFSYVNERRVRLGQLPWTYSDIVRPLLQTANSVLDIDTGGGEILADLLSTTSNPRTISAIEGYAPNVLVARQKLVDFGVDVYDTSNNLVNFDDTIFDLVLDRHGGSLLPEEIFRILQPGGGFITEQIGDQTNNELRTFFDCGQQLNDKWPHNSEDAERVFSDIGFSIDDIDEFSYPVRFMDVGALVYYLKAVPHEIPEFSIQRYSSELIDLHHGSVERGYAIDATYHAYMVLARKG